jgi:hypothetical protein
VGTAVEPRQQLPAIIEGGEIKQVSISKKHFK